MDKDNYILRGFYKPSFFSLFINGRFNEDYSLMSTIDLGTFVHEYIHYLQNITTTFGLRNSIFYFNYLFEVKKHIYENNLLELPLEVNFSDKIRRGQTIFSLCNGTNKFLNQHYDDIKITIRAQEKEGIAIDSVIIELFLSGIKMQTIVFGNSCVKESMAFLYQQYFDSDVQPYLIPYQAVELLCKVINPELLTDKRKIIALCTLALNSQNCGLALYELICKSKEDNNLNGIELYKKYLPELTVKNANKPITVRGFLLESIDDFREYLSASINADLKHFGLLLDNVKMSADKDFIPLIEVLYKEETSNIEKLKLLIDFYGIPHIRTIDGYNFFPQETDKKQPAIEYVELIGQRIVLDRLLGIDKEQIGEMCSLHPQCELSETELIDDNCYGTQWKRTQNCPFKIISDNWELDKKTIK